jgi:integrase
VTSDDVARLHQKMRRTPVHANRALALVAKVFHMAEQWGLRPSGSNPARGIQKYREIKRTRRLSLEELGRFGGAITAAEAGPLDVPGAKGTLRKVHVGPFALAGIKLLVFTGARKSEILEGRWPWLDRDRAVLRLPDSKTGPKDIVLPAPALAVLDGLPRVDGNPHILPGARDGQPLVNISKPLAAILSAAKLEGVSLHVLRHSFASIGVDAGLSLPIVGKLLGHAQASTTQRYAHVADPVRAAGELVAGRIAAAMNGTGQ